MRNVNDRLWREVKAGAALEGMSMVVEFVIKEDWTGKDLSRPGLARIFEMARKGSISGLIVFTLDRLYRPREAGG